jgi:hypothetical protein
MADKALEELSTAGALDGADLIYIVQDGVSYKLDLATLKTFINTDPTVVPASEPFVGARVKMTSTDTSGTSEIAMSWDAEDYDYGGFWSSGAATRLTIPSGVTMVQLSGALRSTGGAATTAVLYIRKNGSEVIAANSVSSGFTSTNLFVASGPIEVTPGDYFELMYGVTASGRTVGADRTFFSIEAIEHTL